MATDNQRTFEAFIRSRSFEDISARAFINLLQNRTMSLSWVSVLLHLYKTYSRAKANGSPFIFCNRLLVAEYV